MVFNRYCRFWANLFYEVLDVCPLFQAFIKLLKRYCFNDANLYISTAILYPYKEQPHHAKPKSNHLLSVARTCNFSRSAAELSLTQPAVSQYQGP